MTQPRLVLCALLDRPTTAKELCRRFTGFEYNEEFSAKGPDPRMTDAFNYCDNPTHPTLQSEDLSEIKDHKNVAYLMSPVLTPENAMGHALRALLLVSALFEKGCRAVKCESSGVTHGHDAWLKMDDLVQDPKNRPMTLYYAWVRRPVSDDPGVAYSCGMHLIGHPDIEIVGESEADAAKLIDAVAAYTIPDQTGERLKAGQKFATGKDAPRYRVEKTSCTRFDQDDLFFNPSGYWNLKRRKE